MKTVTTIEVPGAGAEVWKALPAAEQERLSSQAVTRLEPEAFEAFIDISI